MARIPHHYGLVAPLSLAVLLNVCGAVVSCDATLGQKTVKAPGGRLRSHKYSPRCRSVGSGRAAALGLLGLPGSRVQHAGFDGCAA
jgi:hypothetical protein